MSDRWTVALRVFFWWAIAVASGLFIGSLCKAEDRPRAPIPRAPLLVSPAPEQMLVDPKTVLVDPKQTRIEPSTPAEQSDLHSHVCSNPRCNHEWWHDPRKGPVSHNCPKCGREQYVINRINPPGARSTASPAASLQQVVRAPASQKTVYVVGSTTCYPCRMFKQKRGDGDDNLRYVYCYMDQRKPESFDVATWNELVKLNNSGRFVYPFFVVRLANGEFVGAQARVE